MSTEEPKKRRLSPYRKSIHDRKEEQRIRGMNTYFLLRLMLDATSDDEKCVISQEWIKNLEAIEGDSAQIKLSLCVARSPEQVKSVI